MREPESEEMKQLSHEELENDESRQLEGTIRESSGGSGDRAKYGNLRVISSSYCHMSIGPDCKQESRL